MSKAIKPVKAWAIVYPSGHVCIWSFEHTKAEVLQQHGPLSGERIVQFNIRPIAPKKKVRK